MLSQLAPDVWEATQPLKVAGFDLGHRMTVIRLGSGELVIHSPISLSSAVVKDIEGLGEVKFILAPSAMHDLYLAEWMTAFPSATLLHSPALKLKGLDSRRATPLTRQSVCGLNVIPIEGMPKIREFIFLHPSSRSLIVCDLVFNLQPGSGLQKLLQKLNGVYETLGSSKLFKAYISDHEAFRGSILELLALEFDRLIVRHGSNVDAVGRYRLRKAFNWIGLSAEAGT